MTDIVEEKPKTNRKALVKGDELHIIETTGPQQLTMEPNQPAIGQRHTTTLDIIKLEDVERFKGGIQKQIDELKEGIVKQNEQKTAIEKMGVHDVGPKLESLVNGIQEIIDMKAGSKKDTAWQKFQRKLFKPVEKGKKGNALLMAFNNWQAYKQLMSQMELNEKRLESAEKSLAMIEAELKANGKASA